MYEVPARMIRKSLTNRISEMRQVVESITKRASAKEVLIREAKGEVVFLRRLSLDIEFLLDQLAQAEGSSQEV